MKSLFAILLFTLATSFAFAGQRENFRTCAAADESWMRRFGNYVVAFDLRTAYDVCRRQYWPKNVNVRNTGCYYRGSWIKAGYYCEPISRH